MTIEKITNQKTESISDIKQTMSAKNTLYESRYQSDLRRNNKPISKQREQVNPNKEHHVTFQGFDVATGKMKAKDENTGKTFNATVLSNGPLAVGGRVMGFPPQKGNAGVIRGPMKGAEIPPVEIPKKPKKKEKEVEEDTLQYILNVYFVTK